ncbi:MAG: peptidoglycan DD-metalloendopeptidase family protein [Actinomycetia bacterium]|nr:peptidoglycan DD-metalloendopeptidase family protein [Actinomycetes bacterium]
MRRLVATLIALCALVPMTSGQHVYADESEAEQAAREIADARERTNQAADAYFAAESVLDGLEVEAQELEAEVADIESQVAALQERVLQVAVNRFTRSSSAASPLLNGFSSAEEQMQVSALTAVITDTSEADLDAFDALNRDLDKKNDELVAKHAETEAQRANAAALRDQATAEVEHLKDVEAERLQDDAVRKALAAEERTRAAQDVQLAAQQAAAPATTTFDDDIDAGGGGPENSAGVAEVGSGGQTGGGGSGGRPGGAGGEDYGGVGWVCPTGDAAVGFGDTWGAPRSGGRRHEGVDMIGPRGTPILAIVDGLAVSGERELGGHTIHFVGADGNNYFYGHLDEYGLLGEVHAGDIIGYMGDTGNAKASTPHLHFEIHPGGGPAVNPYPTVRAHC